MTASARLITADDLLDMRDYGRRYELLKGELRESSPLPGALRGFTVSRIGNRLTSLVEPSDLDGSPVLGEFRIPVSEPFE